MKDQNKYYKAIQAERRKLKHYRVYIAQINQDYYDVSAHDEAEARQRAKQLWRNENGPEVISTEEI